MISDNPYHICPKILCFLSKALSIGRKILRRCLRKHLRLPIVPSFLSHLLVFLLHPAFSFSSRFPSLLPQRLLSLSLLSILCLMLLRSPCTLCLQLAEWNLEDRA